VIHSPRLSILPPVIFILVWIALVCLAMPGFAVAAGPGQKQPVDSVSAINPGSELWREVRQRDQPAQGSSQVKGVDSGVLINPWGDPWARFRMNELVTYGGLLLLAALAVIVAFFAIRGRIRLKEGFSGKLLHRFSSFQVACHWVLAGSFIFLGITGLVLLFGRDYLIPVFGREAFSTLAGLSKNSHNLMGILFIISLLVMFVALVRRNFYEKGDLKWALTAAGTIGKSHPSIGFFNLGEKFMFWMIVILGLVISASGLILVTPIFGQGRVIMETSHLVHSIASLCLIALTFFHMYLGLYGVEGALDGMKNGYVDVNWAKAHHDRWADECIAKGEIVDAEAQAGGKPDQGVPREA
jgi:formate dehydrogenase subunit gamma